MNITSVAGGRAWPEDVAYNASKAGVEMLTRTIAVDYASGGVRAKCLAPGVIDAGMTAELPSVEERERLRALHPLGRLCQGDEVAEAAIWLLSDAASFTTGATLSVDGASGRSAARRERRLLSGDAPSPWRSCAQAARSRRGPGRHPPPRR